MKSALLRSAACLLVIAVTISVLADDKPKQANDKKGTADRLEPYECGKVKRLHVFGGIFLASQPQPDDFKIAKESGIKTVVNLRLNDEQDWDEAAHLKKLDINYVHVPFRAPDSLTDEVFAKVRGLLKDKKQQPLILHCASANRVGAIWLAHRVLDGKISYEDALVEAKIVGLRLPAYEEKAKDYIRRHSEKP